jgi:hypothetical protein
MGGKACLHTGLVDPREEKKEEKKDIEGMRQALVATSYRFEFQEPGGTAFLQAKGIRFIRLPTTC